MDNVAHEIVAEYSQKKGSSSELRERKENFYGWHE